MMLRPFLADFRASGFLAGGLLAAAIMLAPPARALELRDEPLSIANESSGAAVDESSGENVGEPAPEDGPVEGEPGPGDTVAVPPDDPSDAGATDVPAGNENPKR